MDEGAARELPPALPFDASLATARYLCSGGLNLRDPGQVMSAKDISALASLPSREELLSKLLGTMQAPIAKFVRTLNEVPGKFVRTVAAVRDSKQAA